MIGSHWRIFKLADAHQIIPHLVFLKTQLRRIAHGLDLTAAALARYRTACFNAVRAWHKQLRHPRIAIRLLHLHYFGFHFIADHRILDKKSHAVAVSHAKAVTAEIFYCYPDQIRLSAFCLLLSCFVYT